LGGAASNEDEPLPPKMDDILFVVVLLLSSRWSRENSCFERPASTPHVIEAIGLEPDRAAADEVDPTTPLTEGSF